MWFREYEDYPVDHPLLKETVEPGKGIIGCEMHELNGWSLSFKLPVKKKRGFLQTLLSYVRK